MSFDMGNILKGFMEAQCKSGPEGGLRYLDGVHAALEGQLRNPTTNPATPLMEQIEAHRQGGSE